MEMVLAKKWWQRQLNLHERWYKNNAVLPFKKCV
jgi:hypothetical protein